MDTHVIPIEQLMTHRAWVRALARRLVIDESQVDDVEQQTWLAALERPPTGRPRAWLAAVVRNLSSKTRRREARLAERHDRAPARGPQPATAHVVAEAELHAKVVKCVLALDEPYKTTLLLRFFEGLPPREIAAEMQAPVETVRSRTRRGLERVRQSLDRDHGTRRGWQRAFLPLLGLDPASLGTGSATAATTVAATGATGATGAFVMSMQAKIGVGVAVALLAGLIIWNPLAGEDAVEPIPVGDPGREIDRDEGGLEGAGGLAVVDPEESEAGPGPAPTPSVEPTEGAWLRVRHKAKGGSKPAGSLLAVFLDAEGNRFEVGGQGGILSVPPAVDGSVLLWLTTPDDGGLYRFPSRAYPAGPTELVLDPPAHVELEFRTPDGPLRRTEVEHGYELGGARFHATWVAEGRFTEVGPIVSRLDNRANAAWTRPAGFTWEADRIRIANTPVGGSWRLLVERPSATPRLLSVPKLEPGKTVLVSVQVPVSPTVQRVRFVAEDTGEALSGAQVTPYYEHGDDQAFFAGAPRTADGRGELRIPYSADDDRQPAVREPTWGVEQGAYVGQFSLTPADTDTDVHEIQIRRGATIKGTAYFRDGMPAEGAIVACGRKGRMVIAHVDAIGRFELAGVVVGSVFGQRRKETTVVLIEDLATMKLNMAKVRVEPGATAGIQIGEPGAGNRATLTGRITSGGVGLAGQYVILKRPKSKSKGAFVKTDAEGRYRHEGLDPGSFEVRVYLGDPQIVDDFYIGERGRPGVGPTLVLGAGETKTLDFDLPAGHIRVRLEDESGAPIQGAVAFARAVDRELERDRFEGYDYHMGWAGLSNADGIVELHGLALGVDLVLAGGLREASWKFERKPVRAGPADAIKEIVITRGK